MGGPLNGKTGEVMRWCIGLAVAALVSYFTAQNTTNERLTKIETRWEFVQGSLTEIKTELKDQRKDIRDIVTDWANGVDRRTGEPLPLQRAIEP